MNRNALVLAKKLNGCCGLLPGSSENMTVDAKPAFYGRVYSGETDTPENQTIPGMLNA